MDSSAILSGLKSKLQKNHQLTLKVKVITKSKQNQIIDWLKELTPLAVEVGTPCVGDEILKIKIAAVPEKGKANKELIRFLSKILNIPQKQVEIIQGETSPRKIIKITLP